MKKKTRILNVWSLVFNVLIIGGIITGLVLYGAFQETPKANMWMEYSVIAGIVALLSSALMIAANIINIKKAHDTTPRLFFSLRMISAVMSAVTLLFAIYVFIKMTDRNPNVPELILYIAVPVASLLEFVLFELEPVARFKKTFTPFIFTVLYCAISISAIAILFYTKGKDAALSIIPTEGYDMFRLHKDLLLNANDKVTTNAIVLAIFVVGSYLVSLLVWGLNRIVSSLVVGVDAKAVNRKEEKKVNKEMAKAEANDEKVTKRVTKFVKKKASFNLPKKEELENAVYHISYANRRNKTWKVKAENTDKAIKIFPTQAEAIEFANQLVEENGGSIRIHSVTGRIRREW